MKFVDLTGQKFGRLIVIRRLENNKNNKIMWLCRCDCGVEKITVGASLKNGSSKSCGCLRREVVSNAFSKHSLSKSKLYEVYTNMLSRCTKPNAKDYVYYGGRGITVCDEWLDKESGLTSFYKWAMDNGYEKSLELDRENNDGNYEPSNCRWVTHGNNMINRRKPSNNTSGYVGVGFVKREKLFVSKIGIEGKTKEIGTYQTKQQALEARNNYIIENNLTEYKIQEWRGEVD